MAVYTLPIQPFAADYLITAVGLNADLAYIIAALNGFPAGPILAQNGSVTAPSYSFLSDPDTGFYLESEDVIGWAWNGTLGATFNFDAAGGVEFKNNVQVDGSLTIDGNLTVDGNILNQPIPAAACQLFFNGGTGKLVLEPHGGNLLNINGINQIIPSTGVTLSASNTASTFVYIYAFMNSGAMNLEQSTTGYTVGSNGIQIKSGDPTRTLVGAAFTDTGGAFNLANGKLWVLSYYNRRVKTSFTTLTTSLNTSSNAYVEVDTNLRNNFICWTDDYVTYQMSLFTNTAIAGNTIWGAIFVDGTLEGTGWLVAPSVTNSSGIYAQASTISLVENANHIATIKAESITSQNFYCSIGTTPNEGTRLYVTIFG